MLRSQIVISRVSRTERGFRGPDVTGRGFRGSRIVTGRGSADHGRDADRVESLLDPRDASVKIRVIRVP